MADLSEEELQALYCWIDEIPLTRQKKNIARDFSDGGACEMGFFANFFTAFFVPSSAQC